MEEDLTFALVFLTALLGTTMLLVSAWLWAPLPFAVLATFFVGGLFLGSVIGLFCMMFS